MTLVQKIEQDLIESQRAKQQSKTAVLRLVKNALKNVAIEKRVDITKLTDEQAIAVLRSEVKKRKESIEAFTKGGRLELAQREQDELTLIESYLPALMATDEIKKIVSEVIAEQQLQAPYQFGSLMGVVVKKIAGRADGVAVKEVVQQFITGS
jgi:uncharacterized protein YqeY